MSNVRIFGVAGTAGRGGKGIQSSPSRPSVLGASAITISGPVGPKPPPRCTNAAEDVLAIQQALNRFSAIDGGPLAKLKEDSRFGPLTGHAIRRFQFKWSVKTRKDGEDVSISDGIVDPDGPTLRRLAAGPGIQFSAQDEFNRSIKLTSEVLLSGSKSIAKIVAFFAGNPKDPSLLLSGDPDMIAFERNFHASKSKTPLAMAKFVAGKINRMAVVHRSLNKPNKILAIDLASEETIHATAFSFSGGQFLSGGGPPGFEFHDMHSIYFCPASRAMDDIGIAYVIMHEFGHYVDAGSDDFAYFDGGLNEYLKLTPEKALHNADCYAQFLFDSSGRIQFKASEHLNFGSP